MARRTGSVEVFFPGQIQRVEALLRVEAPGLQKAQLAGFFLAVRRRPAEAPGVGLAGQGKPVTLGLFQGLLDQGLRKASLLKLGKKRRSRAEGSKV